MHDGYAEPSSARPGRRTAVWLLLAAPFLGLLPVGLYARAAPDVLGLPFFYAYQLLWVPAVAGCLAAAGLLDAGSKRDGGRQAGGQGK